MDTINFTIEDVTLNVKVEEVTLSFGIAEETLTVNIVEEVLHFPQVQQDIVFTVVEESITFNVEAASYIVVEKGGSGGGGEENPILAGLIKFIRHIASTADSLPNSGNGAGTGIVVPAATTTVIDTVTTLHYFTHKWVVSVQEVGTQKRMSFEVLSTDNNPDINWSVYGINGKLVPFKINITRSSIDNSIDLQMHNYSTRDYVVKLMRFEV